MTVLAVRSTGIFCRAGCPAPPPRPDRAHALAGPASARAAGYRACRRCRPDEVALVHDQPVDAPALLGFLAMRAVPGVEQAVRGGHRRALRLPGGPGVIDLRIAGGRAVAQAWTTIEADRPAALAAARALLGPEPAPGALAGLPAAPGLRLPGHPDPAELAIRAVLGQQVSVQAATTVAGRLAVRLGDKVPGRHGAVTRTFPDPAVLAAAPDDALPMPGARRRAVRALAAALAEGMPVTRATLLELPGIGPWTADYVALRMGDPDVLLASDLAVRRGARALGLPDDARALAAHGERWRPRRSWATLALWASS